MCWLPTSHIHFDEPRFHFLTKSNRVIFRLERQMTLLCINCCTNLIRYLIFWNTHTHTINGALRSESSPFQSSAPGLHLHPPVANRCLMFLALATQEVIRVEITPGDRKSMMPWRVVRNWKTKVSFPPHRNETVLCLHTHTHLALYYDWKHSSTTI